MNKVSAKKRLIYEKRSQDHHFGSLTIDKMRKLTSDAAAQRHRREQKLRHQKITERMATILFRRFQKHLDCAVWQELCM